MFENFSRKKNGGFLFIEVTPSVRKYIPFRFIVMLWLLHSFTHVCHSLSFPTVALDTFEGLLPSLVQNFWHNLNLPRPHQLGSSDTYVLGNPSHTSRRTDLNSTLRLWTGTSVIPQWLPSSWFVTTLLSSRNPSNYTDVQVKPHPDSLVEGSLLLLPVLSSGTPVYPGPDPGTGHLLVVLDWYFLLSCPKQPPFSQECLLRFQNL